jgi:hypothetical protein
MSTPTLASHNQRKERRKTMNESAFHNWMEDKNKYEAWLAQTNGVTSTTKALPNSNGTYKQQPNYHRKINKIMIGSYVSAKIGEKYLKCPNNKRRSRQKVHGIVKKSLDNNKWEVDFQNNTTQCMTSRQLQVAVKEDKDHFPSEAPLSPVKLSASLNFMSPLSQTSIMSDNDDIDLNESDSNSNDADAGNNANECNKYEHLPTLLESTNNKSNIDSADDDSDYASDDLLQRHDSSDSVELDSDDESSVDSYT